MSTKNDLAPVIGRRIAEAREACRVTVEELACQAHTTENSLRAWEEGSAVPDACDLAAIALALDVSTDYLVGAVPGPATGRLHLDAGAAEVVRSVGSYLSSIEDRLSDVETTLSALEADVSSLETDVD